jgi:hypothetical protein
MNGKDKTSDSDIKIDEIIEKLLAVKKYYYIS